MPRWRSLLAVLSSALLFLALAGCAIDQLHANRAGINPDIQERLSSVISRNGFRHTLRSERDDNHHFDSIYVSVPLDSLKRRHYSLENLLKEVGRICALPEYSAYPIFIELGASDEEDRLFLREALLKETGEKANIRVTAVVADNHIAIIVNHRDKTLH